MSLSKTPRAVIADDERLMRDQLRTRLYQVWPELEVVAEAKNGLEAVQAVSEHLPDVIFLDIRMPGLTGVEAAKEIAQLDLGDDVLLPEMVFITAYDQYAIDAFEQGVVDYVLKPAESDRLKMTVQRLQKRLALRQNATGFKDGLKISTSDETAGDPGIALPSVQQWLHVLSAQMFLIRKPIKELVEELDPQLFWQIHRSTLINVKAIASIQRDERGRQEVLIKGRNEKLQVSRSASQLFRGM